MIAAIGFTELAAYAAPPRRPAVVEDEPTFDFATCLQRVRQSDQGAARELVDYLYPMVLRIVRGHLPRRMDPEDLAQDVFLKMFSRIEQYRGLMPFPNWVSRIAVTTCIDQLRAQQRRPEFRIADLSEAEADTLEAVMTNDDAVAAPDALAARELVHKLLGQLSPDDRQVLQLLDLEQKSLVEIAQITGLSVGLVKVRAYRARRKLHKMFQDLRQRERA